MAESTAIRLNLGCGRRLLDGYINVDMADNAYEVKPDVSADIRALPFDDDYADEILAVHVFEHFRVLDCPKILKEWMRVLKPDGKLIMELPCFDKVLYWLKQDNAPVQFTMWALYGDPGTHKSEADLHKWCWSKGSLALLLQQVGFQNIAFHQPHFHRPERDMRVECVKPQLVHVYQSVA